MTRPFLRAHWLFLLCSLGLLLPAIGHAEDGGADAGVGAPVPDASVGEGGADRDNPEGEDGVGRVVTDCRTSGDCSPQFTCNGGKCQYSGIREAERVGCLLGPEAALMLGLGAVVAWRRKG